MAKSRRLLHQNNDFRHHVCRSKMNGASSVLPVPVPVPVPVNTIPIGWSHLDRWLRWESAIRNRCGTGLCGLIAGANWKDHRRDGVRWILGPLCPSSAKKAGKAQTTRQNDDQYAHCSTFNSARLDPSDHRIELQTDPPHRPATIDCNYQLI
jgi:hypothetical protein